MDVEKLIGQLRDAGWTNPGLTDKQSLEWDAADALEKLQVELEQAKAERDAALKDIWTAKWISCKYGTGCDFISARTGRPDCAGCGGWEWRGIKED